MTYPITTQMQPRPRTTISGINSWRSSIVRFVHNGSPPPVVILIPCDPIYICMQRRIYCRYVVVRVLARKQTCICCVLLLASLSVPHSTIRRDLRSQRNDQKILEKPSCWILGDRWFPACMCVCVSPNVRNYVQHVLWHTNRGICIIGFRELLSVLPRVILRYFLW